MVQKITMKIMQGVLFYHENHNYYKQFKLRKELSIFSIEAFAILKALGYIFTITNKNRFLIIFDSKSVLGALENVNKKKTVVTY